MKKITEIASTQTPDGCRMVLSAHDGDFSIKLSGYELMNSRQHESEMALARLGCSHLTGRKSPRILIGGLGLGYTLRQTLDMLNTNAIVTMVELLKDVVEWNHEFVGELNNHPLKDKRVDLKICNIVDVIWRAKSRFDAILLDVDNSPNAFTDPGNDRLYGRAGIQACRRALRDNGTLAIWSLESNKRFERLLMNCGFHVRRYRVPSYKGSKSQSHFVWIASENESILPPDGGKPRLPVKKKPGPRQRY